MPIVLSTGSSWLLPFIYTSMFDIHHGIYWELWKAWAHALNETIVVVDAVDGPMRDERGPNAAGQHPGLLGAIQNGTLDGSLVDQSYRPERMRDFYYTVAPITFSLEAFFERVRYSEKRAIVSFIAFSYPAFFTLLVLSAIARGLHLVSKAQKAKIRLQYGFYALASILIVAAHSAVFSGNAALPQIEPATKFADFISSVRRGHAKVVMDGYYPTATIEEIIGYLPSIEQATSGQGPLFAADNMQMNANEVCNPNVRSGMYVVLENLFTVNPNLPFKLPCPVRQMDPGNFLRERTASFDRRSTLADSGFFVPFPSTLYFSKRRFTARQRERMVVIALALFRVEQIETFWWRRYTNRPRFVNEKLPEYTYRAIDIASLRMNIYVACGLYALASIILLAEIGYKKWRSTRD